MEAERAARRQRWRVRGLGWVLPIGLIGVILGADILEGPGPAFVGVLVLVPMLSAVFAPPRQTAAVGAVTVLSALLFGIVVLDDSSPAQNARVIIVMVTAVAATVASALRVRAERHLDAARIAVVRAELAESQTRRDFARFERQERQRTTYLQVLGQIEQMLDADAAGGVSPFQHLVDRLVPDLVATAVVEGRDDVVIASAGMIPDDQAASHPVVREFDGGSAGPLRLRVWRRTPRPSDDERFGPFVAGLAERISVALIRHETRRRQLEISAELQKALLPTELAHAPGVEVAGAYVPAGEMVEVGGDWYDSIALADGRLLLVVGDVVGHGLQAGAVMGRLRSTLAGFATMLSDPSELLLALDRYASHPAGGVGYATAVCAVLDPATGAIEYSSAGHPPILAIGPDGAGRWLDRALSAPLATFVPAERPQAHDLLEPGTTLVLYTDGLIERRGVPLDASLEQLRKCAALLHRQPAPVLAQQLVSEMVVDRPSDDIAVLAVRLGGHPVEPWSVTFAAQSRTLATMRRSAEAWLRDLSAQPQCVADALLVLTEAASNSIDHAYPDSGNGTYTATMGLAVTGELIIKVTDHGTWRKPGLHSADRGRGTLLIDTVCTSVQRRSDTSGTRVTARIALHYNTTDPQTVKGP